LCKITIRLGFIFSLFARFEGQRLTKLNRDTTQKAAYVIDPADVSLPGKIGHVKRVILAVVGHAEASGYLLAEMGTGVVGSAGKRSTFAGEVDHLALGELAVEVFGKPYRPVVTQSVFCSSVNVIVHICKSTN
jgi:hypothetical protein